MDLVRCSSRTDWQSEHSWEGQLTSRPRSTHKEMPLTATGQPAKHEPPRGMGDLRTHYCYLRHHRRAPDRGRTQMSPEWRSAYSGPLPPRTMRGHHASPAERTPSQRKKRAGTVRARTPLGAVALLDVLVLVVPVRRRAAVNGGVSGGVAVRSAPQERTSEVSCWVPSVTHWRPSPCNLITVRPQCLSCARATADLHDVDQLPGTPSPPENTGERPLR